MYWCTCSVYDTIPSALYCIVLYKICCVCVHVHMFVCSSSIRPVMEDIDVDNAIPEDKAREYFIDLILGLEYCKCMVCIYIHYWFYMYMYMCNYNYDCTYMYVYNYRHVHVSTKPSTVFFYCNILLLLFLFIFNFIVHSCKVVHRDIKPENLLLDDYDRIKVGGIK